MRRRFEVDENGMLVDRDGNVLGKIVGLTIDVDTATTDALGVGGHIGGSKTLGEGSKEDGGSGGKEPSREEPLSVQVNRVWEHFLAATGRRQRAITPSNARLIKKGLAEAMGQDDPVAYLTQAIDGLVAWVQRKGGESNLSRVFKTRPNGSPLGEQIEFFAKQAPSAGAGSAVVPSEVAASISDAKRNVHRGVAFPGNAMAKRQMEEAKEYLESVGIAVSVVFDPLTKRQIARFSDGEA